MKTARNLQVEREELHIKIYALEVKSKETQQMEFYTYEDRRTLGNRYLYLYM